jgi:hypothetical protein
MAIKQAKTKADVKVDTGATTITAASANRNIAIRRHGRALGRLGPIEREQRGQRVPKASLNGAEVVDEKPEQARSCSKPIAERAPLGTASVSGTEQPPAGTKRAKLIGLLE